MNLFPHNIGDLDGEPTVERADALIADPDRRFDLPSPEVLAQEIIDHLEAARMSFRDMAAGLANR